MSKRSILFAFTALFILRGCDAPMDNSELTKHVQTLEEKVEQLQSDNEILQTQMKYVCDKLDLNDCK